VSNYSELKVHVTHHVIFGLCSASDECENQHQPTTT